MNCICNLIHVSLEHGKPWQKEVSHQCGPGWIPTTAEMIFSKFGSSFFLQCIGMHFKLSFKSYIMPKLNYSTVYQYICHWHCKSKIVVSAKYPEHHNVWLFVWSQFLVLVKYSVGADTWVNSTTFSCNNRISISICLLQLCNWPCGCNADSLHWSWYLSKHHYNIV